MATRTRDSINDSLQRKGFLLKPGERDHYRFVYYSMAGKKTSVHTKTSYGSKYKVIGDILLKEMSKQCKLSKADFLSLVDCPLNQEEYENKLRTQNISA